jgi:hypothetical protein
MIMCPPSKPTGMMGLAREGGLSFVLRPGWHNP